MRKHVFILITSIISLLVIGCSNGEDNNDNNVYSPANGAFSYVNESIENKNKIIGALEKWAIDNKLTGITLYGDGGYQMYHSRIKKGVDKYLPGFGCAVISDGAITADLKAEKNPSWKRYYHTHLSKDPETLNYFDYRYDLSSLYQLVNGEYFTKVINKDKTGYEWVGHLSKINRPIPLNLDKSSGQASKYRLSVKVGEDFKYATLSSQSKFSQFNGRNINLEDYVTSYKLLFTQAFNFVRNREHISGDGSIKGAKEYVEASINGINEEAWKNVGIKSTTNGGESYLEFEFNHPCTPFYAMYYLNSYSAQPVPEDFIKTIGDGDLIKGASLWGNFSSDNSLTPIDTYLSTGPYVIEKWDKNEQIVLKKNSFYKLDKRYAMKGVHFAIIPEANESLEYVFDQYLSGKLDAAIVPASKNKEYRQDKRTVMNPGSSPYRLNMNTCSSQRWEELFGENGSIHQTPKSEYWSIKPAMSNKNFLAGLSYAINRETIADAMNKTPIGDFCGYSGMTETESGVSYNFTEEHKKASESVLKDTKYGYSLSKAKNAFSKASKELIKQGLYKKGDTIEIEIAWQTSDQIENLHNLIKEQCEKAFNNSNSLLKLKINSWVGDVWSDVFYKKMMVGQFDLGFGNISGGAYHAYVNFENLVSDNRYDFTLNWGADTSIVDKSIVYDNKCWSYNSLLAALIDGVYVEDGKDMSLFDVLESQVLYQDDGSLLINVSTKEIKLDKNTWSRPRCFRIYASTDNDYNDYDELEIPIYDENGELAKNITYDKEKNSYSTVVSKDIMDEWKSKYPSSQILIQGVDLYYTTSLLGNIKNYNYWAIWEGLFEK